MSDLHPLCVVGTLILGEKGYGSSPANNGGSRMAKAGIFALRDLALGDDGVASFLWCYCLCDTSNQVVLLAAVVLLLL